MKIVSSSRDIGTLVHDVRKHRGISQGKLALYSGVGVRFIKDLERGKPTCELEKTLQILKMLGIALSLEVKAGDL